MKSRTFVFIIVFWDQLEEINTLIETHGFELLLASLSSNNDPVKVRKLFPVISKLSLPVDMNNGFSDEQIIIIFNIIEELCKELCPGYTVNIEFGGEYFQMAFRIRFNFIF